MPPFPYANASDDGGDCCYDQECGCKCYSWQSKHNRAEPGGVLTCLLPVLKILSALVCAGYLDSIFGCFPKCGIHGGGIVRSPVFTNQKIFHFFFWDIAKIGQGFTSAVKVVPVAAKVPQKLSRTFRNQARTSQREAVFACIEEKHVGNFVKLECFCLYIPVSGGQ